ncbi:MAG: fructokinase [Dongia sp.]
MGEHIRVGIDLGGTKIEILAIDHDGKELVRHRVATPRGDYEGSIRLMADLVSQVEHETGRRGTVGVAIPGSISRLTGLIKNANSVWLNGRPLDKDLSAAMSREVRCVNDANCLAVSEATDGAGAGFEVVFAVIIGTGTGAGITFRGRPHNGPNGIAGEYGHNPLPWPNADEFPGSSCYCGKHGCLETWISGSGLEADYQRTTGTHLTGREILTLTEKGDATAEASVRRYESRLTRGLAHVVNILDPDVIVLGGGMSRVQRIYPALAAQMKTYVFGKEFDTPIRPAVHGDSSGIRGAAWLWPKDA